MDNSYRAFGIALTGLLLEHEWPADITRVLQQVHDALGSNNTERISRASRASRADYAAACAADYAADYAIRALPGEATRIRALHTLLTQ